MKKRFTIDEKFIIIAIPILFLLGSLFHFIYEWSGNNFLVALIAPKSESVWEHMKLAAIPIILWWCGYYLVRRRALRECRNSWFTAAVVSTLVSSLTIPLVYYFYTGAFGVQSLFVDMFILLLGNTIGQLIALNIFRRRKGFSLYVSLFLLLLIVVVFMVFSVYPLNIPIFI